MTEELKRTFGSTLIKKGTVDGASGANRPVLNLDTDEDLKTDPAENESEDCAISAIEFAVEQIRRIIEHLESFSKNGSSSVSDVDKAVLAIGKLTGAISRLN